MGRVSHTMKNEIPQKKRTQNLLPPLIFHNLSKISGRHFSSESGAVQRMTYILCRTVEAYIPATIEIFIVAANNVARRQVLQRRVTIPPEATEHFIVAALTHYSCTALIATTHFAWRRYACLGHAAIVYDSCSVCSSALL